MKNLFLLLILFNSTLHAQTEKEASKKVVSQFQQFYNNGDDQSIFELFDDNMEANLPLGRTESFLGGLKAQAGKIKSRSFLEYVRGTLASYKTTFENGVFALNISVNESHRINGLYIEPFKEKTVNVLEKNKTALQLPFNGEWFVFWGGDIKDLNYHVESKAQKGAFYFVIKDENNKSFKTNGLRNEDYYAFGKEITSPCQATVVQVVDGFQIIYRVR